MRNPPTVVAQPEGATLTVPKGFSAKVFAEGGFKRMRWVAVAPGGDVFATDSDVHTLTVLRDTNGDGTADERHVFAEGLARPFGVAFGAGHVYVANAGSIVRWPYKNGQLKAEGAGEKIVEMPAEPGHWTRNIAFSPDGARLYVTLGSSSDAGAPDADRALVFSVKPDGSDRRVLATGLRNPIGLGFEPSTATLVGGRAGARQAGRRPGARLHHQPARGRLLRVAVCLRRSQRGPAARRRAARPGEADAWCPTCCSKRTRR